MNDIGQAVAALDPKKRELLALLLKRQGGEAARTILPVPRGAGPYPASFAQERLWFLDRLRPGDPAYHLPLLRTSHDGGVPETLLRQALSRLVERHEALRTRFVEREGHPFQDILPPERIEVPFAVIDLSGLEVSAEALEAEWFRLSDQEHLVPFDLGRAPLLRARLVRFPGGTETLVLTLHHIVSDGWSLGILGRDLASLTGGKDQQTPGALPSLPVQYVDFTIWQQEQLRGEALERHLGYWRERLTGLPPALDLPADRPRPASGSALGTRVFFVLPAALPAGVAAVGRRAGATLFMTLLAGFAAFLVRWSGEDDLAIGTPVAGRHHRELEPLVGLFVNSLVLRCDAAGDPSFEELLERVRQTAVEAFSHQDLPFEKLVQELRPERALNRQPLFQVMFAMRNLGDEEDAALEPGTSRTFERQPTAGFDLSLTCAERAGGLLTGSLELSLDLFEPGTAGCLRGWIETLLEGVVAAPGRRLSDLPWLTEAERRQLLDWEAPEAGLAGEGGTALDRFRARAAERPEALALAIAGEEGGMTYGDLDRASDRIADRLIELGIGPEDRVALLAGRTLNLVASLLGIWKAGAAYVPLDPGHPEARRDFLLRDSRAAAILEGETLEVTTPPGRRVPPPREGEGWQWGEDRRGGGPSQEEAVFAEAAAPLLSSPRTQPPPPRGEGPSGSPGVAEGKGARRDALAYLLYTSGSTGEPKGVMVEHRHLAQTLAAVQSAFAFTPGDRMLCAAPFPFDIFLFELLAPLCAGATAVLFDLQAAPDSGRLAGALAGVTRFHAVPALMRQIVDATVSSGIRPTLREVYVGGEAVPSDLLAGMAAAFPGARRRVLYGPTETAILATAHEATDGESPSLHPWLGRPLPGVTVRLRDRWGSPVPAGVPGEVYLGGPGVARGYLGRPDLTAERFVPGGPAAGERLFRTGDLARRREDGSLVFAGRADRQVKVRGIRIEPGEIESALRAHPAVRDAAVIAAGEGSARRLVACLVPIPEGPAPSAADLHAFLRGRLPETLIPAAFDRLDELPRTPHGKVDRRALAARVGSGAGRTGGPAAPSGPLTPAEELLAGIWSEVLGVPRERIGPGDDFFALSGHSLLATQVVARARQVFGVDLPLARLFERATLGELAAEIGARRMSLEGEPADPIPPLAPREDRAAPVPVSFYQAYAWALVGGPVSNLLNIPFGLRLRGTVDGAALRRALGEIVRRHESLRTVFRATPDGLVLDVTPAEAAEMSLPVLDLSALPERDHALRDAAADHAGHVFDLTRGPLLAVALARLGPTDHALLCNLHHAVSDGWSVGVFQRELAVLYTAFAQGLPSPLPELPLQFSDFASWQHRLLSSPAFSREIAWWRAWLGDPPRPLDLRGDHPRPSRLGPAGATSTLLWTGGEAAALQALAASSGCTLTMTLLAGIAVLLRRYTGEEDLILGTVFSGRNRPELSSLIGFFMNTVPLRVDLAGAPDFRAVQRRVREAVLAAYAHQDVPFPRLVAELYPGHPADRTILFRVLLNTLDFPVGAATPASGTPSAPALAVETLSVFEDEAKYDLLFTAQEGPGRVRCDLLGALDVFEAESVERIREDFEDLLRQAAQDPEASLDGLVPGPRWVPRVDHPGKPSQHKLVP